MRKVVLCMNENIQRLFGYLKGIGGGVMEDASVVAGLPKRQRQHSSGAGSESWARA